MRMSDHIVFDDDEHIRKALAKLTECVECK